MPIRKVEELTRGQFDDITNSSNVVIDFYHEWKMPCILMAPLLDKVVNKFNNARFCRVNVGEFNEVAKKFGVEGFPTIIIFNEGKEVDRITEEMGVEQFEERLSGILK